jgi:hypothetical protein
VIQAAETPVMDASRKSRRLVSSSVTSSPPCRENRGNP